MNRWSHSSPNPTNSPARHRLWYLPGEAGTGEAIHVTSWGLKWPVERPLVLQKANAKETCNLVPNWNQNSWSYHFQFKSQTPSFSTPFFAMERSRSSAALMGRFWRFEAMQHQATRPDWPGKRSKTWERQHSTWKKIQIRLKKKYSNHSSKVVMPPQKPVINWGGNSVDRLCAFCAVNKDIARSTFR